MLVGPPPQKQWTENIMIIIFLSNTKMIELDLSVCKTVCDGIVSSAPKTGDFVSSNFCKFLK